MNHRIPLISNREYCDPEDRSLEDHYAKEAERHAEYLENLRDERRDREAERHDGGGEP